MIRKPVFRRPPVAAGISQPPPVFGWDAKSPLAGMRPEAAVTLENWFPQTASVVSRPGSTLWVNAMPEPVESLMTYESPQNQRMFAGTRNGIFDVTATAITVWGPAASTSSTNGRFISANFQNFAGSFLVAVNGVDPVKLFDGTSWSAAAITGVDPSTLKHVTAHKHRLWFLERASMNAWHLQVEAIQGAASQFPLGAVFTRGGELVSAITWTLDAGNGSDDYLVFITSKGEIAVYQGIDPTDAANWSLIGVYFVGEPLGNLCLYKFGGDVVVLTQSGAFPLSKLLQSATINRDVAMSDRISQAFTDAATSYGENYGWQPVLYPTANLLLVNVPTAEGVRADQFAMNTITGAWSRFTGMAAICWTTFNNRLYFGTADSVCRAWTGVSDLGAGIEYTYKSAYNYFGERARRKQVQLTRPMLRLSGAVQIALGMSSDFSITPYTSLQTLVARNDSATWDSALWDGATWGEGVAVVGDWMTVRNSAGYAQSLLSHISTADIAMEWMQTDYTLFRGGLV